MTALDVDAVQAFVLVADLRSFTRAAEVLGTTQSTVSLKLKRLEDRLERRLVERTPRLVRLSAEGVAFLEPARALLEAHERALDKPEPAAQHLTLGISDHVAGAELPQLLARINAYDPRLALEVRVDFSHKLLAAFDHGAFDAVIVRRAAGRRDGEVLGAGALGWFAAPGFRYRAGDRLRVAALAPDCGIRGLAIRALDKARIPWTETFVGGGVSAVCAAVMAGLGVAALARRVAPLGAVDVGARLSLPPLPASPVVLHSSVAEPRARGALRALAAAFRAAE